MCVSSVSIDLIPLVFVYGGPASSGWGVGNFLLKAARKKKMVVGGTFRQRTAPFPLGVTSRFLATTRPTNSETPLLIKKGSKQLTFFFLIRSVLYSPAHFVVARLLLELGWGALLFLPALGPLSASERRKMEANSVEFSLSGKKRELYWSDARYYPSRNDGPWLLLSFPMAPSSRVNLHDIGLYWPAAQSSDVAWRRSRCSSCSSLYIYIIYIYIFSVRLFLFPWWSFTPEPERITTIRPSDGQLC